MAVELKPPRNRKSVQEDRYDRDTITKFKQSNRDIKTLNRTQGTIQANLDTVNANLDSINSTLTLLQSSINGILDSLDSLDSRLDVLEAKEPLFFYASISFVGAGTQDRTFNHNLGYVPTRFSVTPFNTSLFPDHRVDEVTTTQIRITIGVSGAAVVDVSVIVWPNDP